MSALKNDLGSSGPRGRMRERVKELLRPRPGSKGINRHVQRYAPLYVLGMIWLVMVAAFPTVLRSSGAVKTTGGPGETSAAGTGGEGTVAPGEVPGQVSTTAPGTVAKAGAAAGRVVGTVAVGTGVTRGGFPCRPGVRQIPISKYANPCVAKFEGFNGGPTARGVTKDIIRLAMRKPIAPDEEIGDEQRRQAGEATNADNFKVFTTYVEFLNNTMELFGRRVVIDLVSQNGNTIDEAQSKGREQACADAKALATAGYFGVIRYPGGTESEPFSDCAAKEGLFVYGGANYFPEQYFQGWHPYVWGIRTECERIARDFSEYLGKRLAFRKAKWAGDPSYQNQDRVFGVYVPNNDGYQRCVNIALDILKRDYGVTIKSRVNYTLDVTQFAHQAFAGVVQFQSDGVTSLILACDALSTRFLTEQAERQGWRPEWIILGVDSQDADGRSRAFDQRQVDGHMFGPGGLGNSTRLFDKTGEANQVYRLATGQDLTKFFHLFYFNALHLFNTLQAAGPILTVDNIAQGMRKLPAAGGSSEAWGTWYFGDDHTAVDDFREVYWVGTATAFDGKRGAWFETYGGRRFKGGEWPREEPHVYPN